MTTEEVYEFVRRHVRETGEPVVTSREVAEALDCSQKTAKTRLRELVDEKQLCEKKVARSAVWYLKG